MATALAPPPQASIPQYIEPPYSIPQPIQSPTRKGKPFSIPPRCGYLQPLRTKTEVEARLVIAEASVIRVGVRDANAITKLVDAAIPQGSLPSLTHLRRVAKIKDLSPAILSKLNYQPTPPASRDRSTSNASGSSLNSSTASLSSVGSYTNVSSKSGSNSRSGSRSSRGKSKTKRPAPPTEPKPMYVLAAPSSLLPLATVTSILSNFAQLRTSTPRNRRGSSSVPTYSVHTISIPLTPPTTQAEAKEWSDSYWPAIYRSHNPYGPQPSMWTKAEAGIKESAGMYIALAERLGREAKEEGRGEAIGALVVDSSSFTTAGLLGSIVAGAGDARYLPPFQADCGKGSGNPMAHSTLRVIALVAAQRVALARGGFPKANPVLHDGPLSRLEEVLAHWDYERGGRLGGKEGRWSDEQGPTGQTETTPDLPRLQTVLKEGGYLCTGLDIYLTHEPCVACCMAILHSRFARAVFWRRSEGTGGLSAERYDGRTDYKIDGNGAVIKMDDDGPSAESGNGVTVGNESSVSSAKGGVQTKTNGYGLWHRSELNWRMMAWQWTDAEEQDDGDAQAWSRNANGREKRVFHA